MLVEQVALGGLAAVALVLFTRRLLGCNPVTRRAVAPTLVASIVMIAVFLINLLDVPSNPGLTAAARYTSVGLLPLTVVLGLAWTKLKQAAVGPLVLALDQGMDRGGIREALALCLGDPTLIMAFPDGSGGYLDANGRAFRRSTDSSRCCTPVERHGQVVAVLEHDSVLHHNSELLDSAVAASRLALDNARLTAQVRAQLVALHASRRRLVEAVDTGRRRLERDLHDGAQQQLLGVAISLARAREAFHQGDNSCLSKLLDELGAQLDEAMDELRRLARGIHPPILGERGLTAAVEALAARAPVPVELRGSCPRLPAAVEAAAYFVINEGLTNAFRHSAATYVTVRLAHHDDILTVDVADDGRGGATLCGSGGLQGLVDRVAVEDGYLTVISPPGQGTVVRAELRLPTTETSADPRDPS